MKTTPWFCGLASLLLSAAGSVVAASNDVPTTLAELPAPNGKWIAERRLLDDAWRGRIVSKDGASAVDLGPELYPIGWSSEGDTLHAVRLVDDGHVMVLAERVVVVDGVVGGGWGSGVTALGLWGAVYLGVGAETADVEERRSSPGKLNAAPMVVAIDAGHGGLGAGTWTGNNGDGAGSRGPNGLTEQWVNLRVAQFLFDDLVDDPRFAGSFLLRTSATQQVSLADRVALAAQGSADFYLSIHHNGLPTGASNRTETYFCRLNTDCEESVTSRYAPTSGEACQDMAWRLHDRIVDAFGYTPRGAFEDSAGTGRFHFYVLRNSTMPAVLTEASNLNDPAEESLFGLDPLEQHAKAEAVALHLGLIDLAFGSTGLPTPESPRNDPAVQLSAPRRSAGGSLLLSMRSTLPGLHDFSLVDPLGRRAAKLEPFEGPGEVSLDCGPGLSFPVWFVVRHGGTIVAVRRLP